MAAVVPNPTISKAKFLNWIKAAVAVLITKEEIEPFVYDEIVQFQQKCLQNIKSSNSLQAGSTCSQCCTENVISCPTDRICNVNRRKCSYHINPSKQYRPSGCPNGICHEMKLEIQNAHRYQGPSYKNTDATQWCSNPWEIAKCYMPPDGYKDVSNAADTDFNGFISVILNYKGFEAKISEDLSKKNNIFDKGRDVGKAVRHSPNLEVEDSDLAQYFTNLNNILSDPGIKAKSKSPQSAGQKLAQLQNDDLIIGKDVLRKVFDDEGKAIQEHIRNEMDEYKREIERQKQALIDLVSTKVKAIEDTELQLIETLKSSVEAIEVKVRASIHEIQDSTEQGKLIIQEEIKVEKETAIKEIKEAKEVDLNETGASMRVSEEKYQQLKQELKDNLIKFYKVNHSTISLSPLVEEIETHLAEFYVLPDMVSVKQKTFRSDLFETTSVNSMRDLFTFGDETQQEIYLSADAGFGKTAFSKYLAIAWCETYFQDKEHGCFNNDNLKALSDFNFIFLVLLRDSTSVCSVDEMIEQQIIKKLPPPSESQYQLQDVLRREKCLVILDGLDEWTHPDNNCTERNEKIPHRYVRKNCTILTTTRPWKLAVLNLKTSQINKKIELVKLGKHSMRQLQKNAIRKMGDIVDGKLLDSKLEEFSALIGELELNHMTAVPLLLKYIVCLWCNDIPLGNSKQEVYVNIIEFLLSRTVQKHPDIQHVCEPFAGDIPANFKNHDLCKKFYALLTFLAELAYQTFFDETRENTLVFDRSVAETYLKPDYMKLSLLSGILTESRTDTLIKRIYKISFSHKTFQEFLAAVFLSSQENAQETVLEKCKNITNILDISVIFEFISKMNADLMCRISNGFMSVVNKDEETCRYRTRTGYEDVCRNPLYSIQNMLLACFKEMPEDKNNQLCLQDFIIEGAMIGEKTLQDLSKLNKTNIKSLFIDRNCSSLSLREIIQLFSLTDLNNIQKLYYNGDTEKDVEINLLFFPCLQSLTIRWGKWTYYEDNLRESILRLQCLQSLYIKEFTLSHEIMESVLEFIPAHNVMKELTLSAFNCKEHGHDCEGLNIDLSQHSVLTKLELMLLPPLHLNIVTPPIVVVWLKGIILYESSLLLSPELLNIELVTFEDITMSASSFQKFVNVLEDLPQSVTVSIDKCCITPVSHYHQVRNYIKYWKPETFTVTRNSWWEFDFKKLKREP